MPTIYYDIYFKHTLFAQGVDVLVKIIGKNDGWSRTQYLHE